VKLGLMGTPTVDHRQDGTDQLVWALRANIMDWAGAGGGKVPLAQMTSARFRVRHYTGKDITSFDANLPGSSVSIRSTSPVSGAVVVYVAPETADERIAALAPTHALDDEATCDQPNGAIPNPPLSTTTPVSYTVTPQDAADLPARVYSVVVTRVTPPFAYSRWTGDADSGLSGASQYPVAVNLGGAAVTVNGVAFQASALEGEGFSIAGGGLWINGGAPNVAGESRALASDFPYGGTPLTVTFSGLTPGATYETALLSYGWEGSGRTETFASGDDSRVVDQDAFGAGEGPRIVHTLVAGPSGSRVIGIAPAAGSAGTFHLCALANRIIRLLEDDAQPPGGSG